MDTSYRFLDDSMDSVSGADASFTFGGDGDQSPPESPSTLFGTPPKKKKKMEGFLTPAPGKDLFSSDESALFYTPAGPAAAKRSSFSSSAPTPQMRSSAQAGKAERKTTSEEGSAQKKPVEVEPRKEQQLFSDIPAPASPAAPERKETKAEAKEGSPNLKEMMEAEMKKMMGSLLALQSHQVKGGAHLLAKTASLQEEVSAYKEKLANIKEDYRARANLALSCFSPTK